MPCFLTHVQVSMWVIIFVNSLLFLLSYFQIDRNLPIVLFQGKDEVRIENSVIKGYHAFKVKPPMTYPPTLLSVDIEYTNIHDTDACLVWVPELNSFKSDMHDIVTDEDRYLLLKDVAGLPVGHVPRTLASAFRKLIDLGANVYCEATDQPQQSFPPWPAPEETGGGAVIPCTYLVRHESKQLVIDVVKEALMEMPEGDFIRLV